MATRAPKTYVKIRAEVEKVLAESAVNKAPVDVEVVAKSLGAEVRYSPFDGELAGMLVRGADEHPIIGVNSLHHPNRQRFTVAHECGHLILHKGEVHVDRRLQVNRRDEISSLAIDPDEIEANRFAAELLMPYKLLVADLQGRQIDVENDDLIKELAIKYGVSVQSMTLRITNLFNL